MRYRLLGNGPKGSFDTVLVLSVAVALFALVLLRHLSYPLLWSDEADTAMFAERVLEHGYPKVHGPRNVVYQFGSNVAVGVEEGLDAFIGTTWGHFYFAAPGAWWAGRVADPYDRTFRMRLPFALAGAAGVGLWALALAPALGGGARRARRFAAAFFLLATVSVSLVLHLREVRYYALVVLLAGALFHVHLGYVAYRRVGYRRWVVWMTLLLFLLFNTFFSAYFAFAALLAAERAFSAWRGRGPWRDLVPFGVSALLVAPLVVFFETFATAAAFAEGFAFSWRDYASNLGAIAVHFLRHEFLLPALVGHAVLEVTGAGSPTVRRVTRGLGLFALGYVAIGCLNPLALERYFVVLSPLVTGVFLLDAFALVEAAGARAAPAGRRRATALALAGIVAFTGVARWPERGALSGRLAELTTPYRGPLDFAVAYVLAEYPRPEDLVIATNYEEEALMYYLGSHVIIGLSLNNLVRDRQLEPDVVIPRRRWPRSLRELGPFLSRPEWDWEEVRLPVRDLHYNNVPALSRSRFIPDPHRFRTAATADPNEQLLLYRRSPRLPRSDRSKRTGTSSSP